jgi:hypothetical protein
MTRPRGPALSFLATVAGLALSLTSCGETDPTGPADPPPPPPPPAVASIRVQPSAPELTVGETTRLVAMPLSAQGEELEDRTVSWQSGDASKATVGADGTLIALAAGTVVLTVTSEGVSRQVTVTVHALPEALVADILFHRIDAPEMTPRLYRFDPEQPESAPQPVFGSAGTWQVAASADGSRLAFTCIDAGPSPAICTSDRDGRNARMLTGSDLYFEDQPTWSPDGQRIAFRRWPQGGEPGQSAVTDIWVMHADGSNQANVTADADMQHDPAWSPVLADGSTRIAYAQTQMEGGYLTSRVFTMLVDGTDRRPETPGGGGLALEPAWSPDGLEIAYFKDGGEVLGDLWVTRVGLREERPLIATPLEGEQRAPAYSPDGRHVLFTSAHELTEGTTYRMQLYTVRADGTDLVRRTGDLTDKHDPAWIVRP